MDEARVGQKGRNARAWYERGSRPTVPTDQRYGWAYIYGAVRPGTDEAFALVLPTVSTEAMSRFLSDFSETLPPDVHVVLVLDRAGWHLANALEVPDNLTLVHQPPYSPELNPVERIWLYMRERWLSHRLFADTPAIIDACCEAWNRLLAEPGRLASLTDYPYLRTVTTS
jgi:transposase